MKAIINGCSLDNAIRIVTPPSTGEVEFSHLCFSGPTGRAVLQRLVPTASGLFVFGHPTLGLWSTVPARFKRSDGGVPHVFSGVTPDQPEDPADIVDPLTGAVITVAQQFAARNVVELFVLGHLRKFVNGTRRDEGRFVGLALDEPTLLDAIAPSAVPYRSDQDTWASVSLQFKDAAGRPRIDPDNAQETTLLRMQDPGAAPPLVP